MARVTDLDWSLKFYTEVLGLKEVAGDTPCRTRYVSQDIQKLIMDPRASSDEERFDGTLGLS